MSLTVMQEKNNGSLQKTSHVRLDYLDGLRGLAALYVVISHAFARSGTQELASHSLLAKTLYFLGICLGHGHNAVAVFIVLSGYCLMLPVARTENATLPGGVMDFIKRRAQRILPPYYAALLISLLFIVVASQLHWPAVEPYWFTMASPVFTPGVLWSHLFLIHNWTPYMVRIDPPMWSVAVEWQIYFLFPLLLLPLYRRFGSAAMMIFAFAVALGGHFIGHARFDQMHPWFLGLFGMGMAAAAFNFAPKAHNSWTSRLPWFVIFLVATALLVFVSAVQRNGWRNVPGLHWFRLETWGGDWPLEIITGIVASALILHCTQRVLHGTQDRLLLYRLFNSKVATTLGVFSYSIYLIHDPVLECVQIWCRHLPESQVKMLMLGVGVPLAVGVAYLFHLVFEKRFMPAHYRAVEKRILAAGQE